MVGLATIYDKDILIYAVSQLMAALNSGEKVSRRIRVNSYEFLRFANRGHGGREYNNLVDSLKRLNGTKITTNIHTGGVEDTTTFGLIDESTVRRQNGDGRILWVEIVLSDWVFKAIRAKEVLTLNRDYFRLRKPLERRIYELARKHCGRQDDWKISIDMLLKKSGSRSPRKRFKQLLKEIAKGDHLQDYHDRVIDEDVFFYNRGTMPPIEAEITDIPSLPAAAYDAARIMAPGWDAYALEQEWRSWVSKKGQRGEPIKNPARHFAKFCETWYEKNGPPS